jgi:hypothetical protein
VRLVAKVKWNRLLFNVMATHFSGEEITARSYLQRILVVGLAFGLAGMHPKESVPVDFPVIAKA